MYSRYIIVWMGMLLQCCSNSIDLSCNVLLSELSSYNPRVNETAFSITGPMNQWDTYRDYDNDTRYMHHAIQLAKQGLGNTRPNPCVGCVIVSEDGVIVGRGFHRRAGRFIHNYDFLRM